MHVPTFEEDGQGSRTAGSSSDHVKIRDSEGPEVTIRLSGEQVRLGPDAIQAYLAILQTALLLYVVYSEANR